jgi:hypothetical protein
MKDCQPAETVGLVCGRIGNMQYNGAVEILEVFDGAFSLNVYDWIRCFNLVNVKGYS